MPSVGVGVCGVSYYDVTIVMGQNLTGRTMATEREMFHVEEAAAFWRRGRSLRRRKGRKGRKVRVGEETIQVTKRSIIDGDWLL